MGQVNLGDYKNIYLQTAKEYVNNLFSSYEKLSANPQDSEAVNLIHISSHSLRSQSQVMGFENMADSCISIEKISSDILNGVRANNDEFMGILKNSVEKLNSALSQIEKMQ